MLTLLQCLIILLHILYPGWFVKLTWFEGKCLKLCAFVPAKMYLKVLVVLVKPVLSWWVCSTCILCSALFWLRRGSLDKTGNILELGFFKWALQRIFFYMILEEVNLAQGDSYNEVLGLLILLLRGVNHRY